MTGADCDITRALTLNTLSRLKGIETFSPMSSRSAQCASEYTFPFEGNWNDRVWVRAPALPAARTLWIHFPVWRELKQMLLLLKARRFLYSEYTFPFEGNWNCFFQGFWWFCFSLWIHFPVWRELKLFDCVRGYDSLGVITLNTLSRLKGIETILCIAYGISNMFLWIHFPVWRELKLKLRLGKLPELSSPTLNTLSRLKGIETWWRCAKCEHLGIDDSEYTFPFEGNWNSFAI